MNSKIAWIKPTLDVTFVSFARNADKKVNNDHTTGRGAANS